ncbi:MAG: glycosyl transferase [Rickettsiales bacterium]|nr:glycosyl transferase [Rickettsiales bacterium]
MSDFYQNGIVATLHNFSQRTSEDLEAEILEFSKFRPITLILPSLYSELMGNALPKIIDEISKVKYLQNIVIGIDRANEKEFNDAKKFFSKLPQKHEILWNDGPNLKKLDKKLSDNNLAPQEMGKGRNVWYCMGYILALGNTEAVALHDCDIVTYNKNLLSRLVYPVANPKFNFDFCKGYYPRISNKKVKGRVSRLLVTPLLRALEKTIGTNEFISFIDSFRYPLAGEFSFRRRVLKDIRIPYDWGLEIGVLSEMFRNYAGNRLCQVDIADNYDHKHQEISFNDSSTGLSKMSIDISKVLIRKLASQGEVFSMSIFRSLKATYFREALDFVQIYKKDAMMNSFEIDVHEEESAVELFAKNIMEAGQIFLDSPMESPNIPTWNRVDTAFPNFLEELRSAVESDNKG